MEVKKYAYKLKRMRDGPSKDMEKKKALRVLRQKKKYEQKLDGLRNKLSNVEEIDDRIQSYKDNVAVVSMLQFPAHCLVTVTNFTNYILYCQRL